MFVKNIYVAFPQYKTPFGDLLAKSQLLIEHKNMCTEHNFVKKIFYKGRDICK